MMDEELWYQIIFGGLFFGLLAFGIVIFLQEPKQIIKDFFKSIYSGIGYNLYTKVLSYLFLPVVFIFILFRIFKSEEIFTKKK